MTESTINYYKRFLNDIKKESTGVITITKFNDIINEAQEIVVRDKSLRVETDSKLIDDLRKLRVITDGINGNPPAILPVKKNQFSLPVRLSVGLVIQNPPDQPFLPPGELVAPNYIYTYPEYLKFQNVSFKVTYNSNNLCKSGISDWLYTRIMRSDSRTTTNRNPYRVPTAERPYYDIIDNKINFYTDNTCTAHSMRIEYLRKPRRIFLDTLSGAMLPDGVNPTYLPGVGSVDCEFTEFMRQEIIDTAVRMYLERTKEDRYKSFLNEEAIKTQSKS